MLALFTDCAKEYLTKESPTSITCEVCHRVITIICSEPEMEILMSGWVLCMTSEHGSDLYSTGNNINAKEDK